MLHHALPGRRRIIDAEIQLGPQLGFGTGGVVYRAERKASCAGAVSFVYPPIFVVKVMRRDVCTEAFVKAIHRELRTIGMLDYPHIVHHIGSWLEKSRGPHHNCFCLAMDYCNGGDLDQLIAAYRSRRTHLPCELVTKLIVHVLAALAYSHAHRVIHRDVKPANTFLMKTDEGVVDKALLGDYGIARPLETVGQMVSTRAGTPCYCSPEMVSGEGYTTKTDIFSAGAMFFELLLLERPFWREGFSNQRMFHAVLFWDPRPRLWSKGREYSPSLLHIVTRCLAKRERDRPSARDLLGFLTAPMRRHLPPRPASSPPAETSAALRKWQTQGRRSGSRGGEGQNTASSLERTTPSLGPTGPTGTSSAAPSMDVRDGTIEPKPTPVPPLSALRRLLEREGASPMDAVLWRVAEGDEEMFALLKILTHSRQDDAPSLASGVVQLLTSMRVIAPGRAVSVAHIITAALAKVS